MIIDGCSAIILAGGHAQRMGQDKAMLLLDGHSLLQTVIATMRLLFTQTLISVSQVRPEIDAPQICDSEANAGPLSGLVTALEKVSTPWAFVVACDMPFIVPDLVEQLAKHRAQCQAVIPVVHGQLQPLAAFYSTTCIPWLRASLSLGNKSLLGAIGNLKVCYVDETELIKVDPQLRSFFDLDTPQDFARAKQMT